MRKTKILVTIGPSSSKENVILRLIREGVDGFRLNFSHGTHEEKRKIIQIIRKFEEKLKQGIPIIGDLQGPVIRIGEIDDLCVHRGDTVYLIYGKKGDSENKKFRYQMRTPLQ